MKIAYTLCTNSYLGMAKSLADSFTEHNPDYHFIIGLVDKWNDSIKRNHFEKYEIIEVEKLNNVASFSEMSKKYKVFELCFAMKPFFADYLLNKYESAEYILYFDSDIYFFNSISHLETTFKKSSVTIAPHITKPANDNSYTENLVKISGMYNAGFFVVNRSGESAKFLKWWQEKLTNFCYGATGDQEWLSFLPLFFDKVTILNDSGINVAHWNLNERFLSSIDNLYIMNDEDKLVFYHYSGFNYKKPDIISSHYKAKYTSEKELIKLLHTIANSLDTNNSLINCTNVKSYYGTIESSYSKILTFLILALNKMKKKL